jgi:DNA-binding transcriptional LysR family regulator
MIEMRHIQAFLTLSDELHFGLAARRLNMTQPPLSQIIRQPERLVGTPLLSRTTRSVSLTAAGEAFLASIRSVPEPLTAHGKLAASRGSHVRSRDRLLVGYRSSLAT